MQPREDALMKPPAIALLSHHVIVYHEGKSTQFGVWNKCLSSSRDSRTDIPNNQLFTESVR